MNDISVQYQAGGKGIGERSVSLFVLTMLARARSSDMDRGSQHMEQSDDR